MLPHGTRVCCLQILILIGAVLLGRAEQTAGASVQAGRTLVLDGLGKGTGDLVAVRWFWTGWAKARPIWAVFGSFIWATIQAGRSRR